MIRWITPTLGTAAFDEGGARPGVTVVDVRDLVDRAGNAPGTLLGHVHAALAALARGERVLICCDHGISRSNAIAAAVLASAEGQAFDDAVAAVLAAGEPVEIRAEVLAAVRAAVGRPASGITSGPLRVLITGGHGRLGRLLRRDPPPDMEIFAPSHAELDLLGGPAPLDAYLRRHGIRVVMHFAQPHATNTNQSLGASLTMLRNVLDAASLSDARVLFPSNWLIFSGHAGGDLVAAETLEKRPSTCLGDAKQLGEQLIGSYVARENLQATVLRSGPVVGECLAPVFLRTICQQALAGAAITTHAYDNGLPALDFISAGDYAAAAWRLVSTGATGTFHASGGRLTSTHRAAELAVAALGSRSVIGKVPVIGETCNVRLDAAKLEATTGWQVRTDPERAISTYARSLARAGALPRGRQE